MRGLCWLRPMGNRRVSAQGQEPESIIRRRDDSVASQLTTEDVDLGFEEANSGVASCGASFQEQVREDVEPSQHDVESFRTAEIAGLNGSRHFGPRWRCGKAGDGVICELRSERTSAAMV